VKRTRTIILPSLLLIAILAAGCGVGDPDGGGKVIANTGRLELAETPQRASAALDKSGGHRSTPTNLSGDLCYAILSLGELGPGMFSMTWLAPESTFPDGPESGVMSAVHFSLAQPENIGGHIVVPESESEMPSQHKIVRAELNFNYVDAEFQLGEPAQTYVVRTVYCTSFRADDAAEAMQKGDKLIKLPGETRFQWANQNGLSTSRADVADGLMQDATVTGYYSPDGKGNPDYIPVTANFHEELPVTYGQITDTGSVWTLSFDLSDAIVWSQDPATFQGPADIVNAFRLKFGPNRSTTQGEDDDGIRADLTIE